MVKRAVPGASPIARPARAAIATPDTLAPFSKGSATPTAKRAASKAPKTLATKPPPADDDTPELQAIFGENLRATRLRCGLHQRQLAALSGLPQQYLSQIELGQKNVGLKTVELLARVLGCDVGSMLRREKRIPEKK